MGPKPMSIWELGTLVIGLVVGSFANVCIHRIPRGESIVFPASHCPRCGHAIRPWHNVPLLGYLMLLGRCRDCRAPISPRYPLVEAAHGLLWWTLAATRPPGPVAFVTLVFLTALVILCLIDLEHQLLPNVITLPGIVLGVAASFLPDAPLTPLESVLSAAGGYLVMAAVGLAWERLRHVEALGQGDWKMTAMLGAFLGWQATLLTIFLASVSGTVVGVGWAVVTRQPVLRKKLPLGTFLGLAAIAVVFVGPAVIEWYAGFLRG
jgi:leader peptidase (prepilin peptidase)/N-methyltransferase